MAWTDRGSLAAYQPLHDPLDEFLVSGGDGRLALSSDSRNAYGCTPFPQGGLIDFASSTASSISAQAYARARLAREELLTASLRDGPNRACEDAVACARQALLVQLELSETGAEVVFSASGTDAQLQTLFLVRQLFPGSLATVIAGADQTGSGTAHTARGHHFSQATASGVAVEKGGVITGLEGIGAFEIGFRDEDGDFRNPTRMDEAVLSAVEQALATHDHVLLQAMEASKFGWKAPSDALLDEVAARWPARVTIVADACQLRITRARLKQLLANGMLVLMTGSKFFTGPAFSGALLVPRELAMRLADGRAPAGQLAGYATRFDWPQNWTGLRDRFSHRFNFGQWLRWEAALEEMRLYYAVPANFRDRVARLFGEAMRGAILDARNLGMVESGFSPEQPTIFPLRPSHNGEALCADACAQIYRAMRRDLSALDPQNPDLLATPCQIGQPVALAHGKAALRLSLSARIVRDCWSANPHHAELNIAMLRDTLCTAVAKLDLLARLDPFSQEAGT